MLSLTGVSDSWPRRLLGCKSARAHIGNATYTFSSNAFQQELNMLAAQRQAAVLGGKWLQDAHGH